MCYIYLCSCCTIVYKFVPDKFEFKKGREAKLWVFQTSVCARGVTSRSLTRVPILIVL